MYVIEQKQTTKMQCAAMNLNETHVAVGSESSNQQDANIHLFDLNYEDSPLKSVTLQNTKGIQAMDFSGRYGGQNAVMVCGTTSGQIQILDWRSRNALAHSVQAFHQGSFVSDLAIEGDVVATCGSKNRNIKLFDIRRPPIRPLPPIPFMTREETSGPSILKLVRGGMLSIVSASGSIQVQSMTGSYGSRRFYQVGRGAELGACNPSLASVTCMDVSSSGHIAAFGSTDGGT